MGTPAILATRIFVAVEGVLLIIGRGGRFAEILARIYMVWLATKIKAPDQRVEPATKLPEQCLSCGQRVSMPSTVAVAEFSYAHPEYHRR